MEIVIMISQNQCHGSESARPRLAPANRRRSARRPGTDTLTAAAARARVTWSGGGHGPAGMNTVTGGTIRDSDGHGHRDSLRVRLADLAVTAAAVRPRPPAVARAGPADPGPVQY